MHVEFYVFEQANQQQAYIGLCQLIEKWYQAKLSVAVLCQTREELALLDQLLWTFNEQSFIPHAVLNTEEKLPPVLLCLDLSQLPDERNVVVNLSSMTLSTHKASRFLAEIVFSEQTVQQLARDRYKQYRDQGLQLKTIKIPLQQ